MVIEYTDFVWTAGVSIARRAMPQDITELIFTGFHAWRINEEIDHGIELLLSSRRRSDGPLFLFVPGPVEKLNMAGGVLTA